MTTNSNHTLAALINLSTLTQYFIPFGNFIFPIMIWSTKKDESEYINQQGKETINFQLSLFMYTLILALIAIPILLVTFFQHVSISDFKKGGDFVLDNFNPGDMNGFVIVGLMAIVAFIFMKVAEFFLIIYASIKTSDGADFKYPLTISFIK
jgi:hypothetical protein